MQELLTMRLRLSGSARAQGLLASLGVQTVGLPAAATTISTWMHGFGFVAMPEEQQRAARSELRILVFPGAAGAPGLAAHRSACVLWDAAAAAVGVAVVVQISSMAAVSAMECRSLCLISWPGCREAGCRMKSHRSTAGKLQAARFVVNLQLLIRCVWRQARSCCASRWRRLQRRLRLLRWMRLRRVRPRPLCQSNQMTQVAQPTQGPQRRRQRSRTRARARKAGQPGLVQRGGQRRGASAGARAPAARRLTRANCRGCNLCFLLASIPLCCASMQCGVCRLQPCPLYLAVCSSCTVAAGSAESCRWPCLQRLAGCDTDIMTLQGAHIAAAVWACGDWVWVRGLLTASWLACRASAEGAKQPRTRRPRRRRYQQWPC